MFFISEFLHNGSKTANVDQSLIFFFFHADPVVVVVVAVVIAVFGLTMTAKDEMWGRNWNNIILWYRQLLNSLEFALNKGYKTDSAWNNWGILIKLSSVSLSLPCLYTSYKKKSTPGAVITRDFDWTKLISRQNSL